MAPPIQFVTAEDGTRIACCGEGEGQPLVFVRGWISHLELMWDDPAFRAYMSALAKHFKVVRFDMRGNGLSERRVAQVRLPEMVLDLEAVIDGLHLENVILYGQCFGGPAAVTYATQHPERVGRLILDGTYACGDEITSPERQQQILATLRDLPEAGLLLMSHYTNQQMVPARFRQFDTPHAISQTMAVHLYELGFRMDVSHLLARVSAPTLVLHRRGSRAIPVELGRQLASAIPRARFVALEGRAHNLWEEQTDTALAAIGDFLGVSLRSDRELAVDASPIIIMFTDIEASTAKTVRLGDAAAQEILRLHNEIVRVALEEHGGRQIKHTGDGIMASLPSATRAIQCAIEIQRAFAQRLPGVGLRVGLNVGEPVSEDDDLFGSAVQLARRVCDRARPGQILAPAAVRHLVAGKTFRFSPRRQLTLKGFDESVSVHEVVWRDESNDED